MHPTYDRHTVQPEFRPPYQPGHSVFNAFYTEKHGSSLLTVLCLGCLAYSHSCWEGWPHCELSFPLISVVYLLMVFFHDFHPV